MDPALKIARLAGPLMAVIGVGMLANGATYRVMAGQFLCRLSVHLFSGILALVSGLAILNVHHRWTPDWRSAITAIGWVITGVGTFRIIAPQFTAFVAGAIVANNGFFVGAGIVLVAFGGYVTFKGYAA